MLLYKYTIFQALKETGKEELQYVGHSMGTTGFMAMAHYRPDIMDKYDNILWTVYMYKNEKGFMEIQYVTNDWLHYHSGFIFFSQKLIIVKAITDK